MKKIYIVSTIAVMLFFLGFINKSEAASQQQSDIFHEKNDGPYLMYQDKSMKIITVKYFEGKAKLKIDSINNSELTEKHFKVKPNSDMPTFSFKLFKHKPDTSYYAKPEKLLVVSDIEGNFESFVEILRVAGVINKKYEWIYGRNHLLINGDLFDRGNDVMAFLWLCYKLDNESQLNGGKVHINLGNHDEMNLRGNTKYAVSKYLLLDSLLNIEHKMLFGENTEIGRWLRNKNCITVIDSTLFVHGGISIVMTTQGLNPEMINQIVRKNLGKDDAGMESVPKFIFGNYGPFWYRGLVVNIAKYRPVTPEHLDQILNYFEVKRIVVGHCIVPEIIGLHGGKVIAADVDHYENKKAKKSRSLLVTNGHFYTINDDGKIKDLPIIQGFIENYKSM